MTEALPARRRLLPARIPAHPALPALPGVDRGDLAPLRDVVAGRFPVRAARTYLQRSLGHEVRTRLVEAERGERLGVVRAIEVLHAGHPSRTRVTARRTLPTGEPASWFVPDARVRIGVDVDGPAAHTGGLLPGDVLVLHVPVRSYLRFLPEILRTGGVASRPLPAQAALVPSPAARPEPALEAEDALRRFLFVFQHLMTTVTDRIDVLPSLTDPSTCAPELLPWLASWVDFELDASLPVHQQRDLVARAIRLYRTRGTKVGLEEIVRVLTGATVAVQELTPPRGLVLGRGTLSGGGDVVGRHARGEDAGCFLVDARRPRSRFFELLLEGRDVLRARFGERTPDVLRRIVEVVGQQRPAHAWYTVRFEADHSATPRAEGTHGT